MSKTLNLVWTNPFPQPSCGYNILYRREGDSSYLITNTSGTTSGSSSLPILVSAPANFEGMIQSNCCSGNNSPGLPFGVNTYAQFGLSIHVVFSPSTSYQVVISSVYPNPYDTYIGGTFLLLTTSGVTSGSTTITFTNVVYPAGSTTTTVFLPNSVPTASTYTTSGITVSSIAPAFNYGGTIQQFDPINTPPYFQFYYNPLPIWNGSPFTLPSFVLSLFSVTEQDTNNNILAGNLTCTWIQSSLYGDGSIKYGSITLTITDPGSNIIGGISNLQTPMGLRSTTISMSLANISYPLTSSTLFTITGKWADGSVIGSTTFYLPPAS